MGFFDSFKKATSGITKGKSLGNLAARGALAPVTGGLSLLSDDTLKGKKTKKHKGGFAKEDPRLAQLANASQKGRLQSIGAYTDEINQARSIDPNAMANQTAQMTLANQEKGIGGQFGDVERKINQLNAQRGLDNSSIGIGSIMNAQKQRSDAINEVRAQAPVLENQLKSQYGEERMNRINNANAGIGSVLSSTPLREYKHSSGGQREGGLLDIGLTAVGAKYGGAAGAKVGQSIGKMMRR